MPQLNRLVRSDVSDNFDECHRARSVPASAQHQFAAPSTTRSIGNIRPAYSSGIDKLPNCSVSMMSDTSDGGLSGMSTDNESNCEDVIAPTWGESTKLSPLLPEEDSFVQLNPIEDENDADFRPDLSRPSGVVVLEAKSTPRRPVVGPNLDFEVADVPAAKPQPFGRRLSSHVSSESREGSTQPSVPTPGQYVSEVSGGQPEIPSAQMARSVPQLQRVNQSVPQPSSLRCSPPQSGLRYPSEEQRGGSCPPQQTTQWYTQAPQPETYQESMAMYPPAGYSVVQVPSTSYGSQPCYQYVEVSPMPMQNGMVVAFNELGQPQFYQTASMTPSEIQYVQNPQGSLQPFHTPATSVSPPAMQNEPSVTPLGIHQVHSSGFLHSVQPTPPLNQIPAYSQTPLGLQAVHSSGFLPAMPQPSPAPETAIPVSQSKQLRIIAELRGVYGDVKCWNLCDVAISQVVGCAVSFVDYDGVSRTVEYNPVTVGKENERGRFYVVFTETLTNKKFRIAFADESTRKECMWNMERKYNLCTMQIIGNVTVGKDARLMQVPIENKWLPKYVGPEFQLQKEFELAILNIHSNAKIKDVKRVFNAMANVKHVQMPVFADKNSGAPSKATVFLTLKNFESAMRVLTIMNHPAYQAEFGGLKVDWSHHEGATAGGQAPSIVHKRRKQMRKHFQQQQRKM